MNSSLVTVSIIRTSIAICPTWQRSRPQSWQGRKRERAARGIGFPELLAAHWWSGSDAYAAGHWVTSQGAAVTVLTACWQPDWPKADEDRGVHVVRLPPPAGSRWATLAYVARLSRWLQNHHREFDLVYVSELKHEAYAAMFASHDSAFRSCSAPSMPA